MADFSRFYDLTIPYLPGAEIPIINHHTRKVLRDFLKRTTVWRQVFQFYTAGDGTSAYQLTPPAGVVGSILEVYINGSDRAAPVVPEDRRYSAPPGVPAGWWSILPAVIHLFPAPNAVLPIKINAAMTLAIDGDASTEEFPDEIFEEHGEVIAAGVISAMMLMPGKPWTQRESALTYGRTYGSAVRDTRGKIRDGGQPNQSTFIAARKFGR